MSLVLVGGALFVQSEAKADTIAPLLIQKAEYDAVLGRSVTIPLLATGGTAPYQWSLVASGLPEGVFMDRDGGRILGSPDRTGDFSFTVQALDAMGSSTQTTLTMRVGLANISATTSTQSEFDPSVIVVNLDTLDGLQQLMEAYPDDAPLIYVGPNTPVQMLKVNIAQMHIKPNGLYRIDGGTASTVNPVHPYADVYYVDPNGRRHAFPTEATFLSWFSPTTTIESVPAWKISNLPLGVNVTLKPGTITRLENTREFMRVVPGRALQAFQDEATYARLMPTVSTPSLTPAQELVPTMPITQLADYTQLPQPIMNVNDLAPITQHVQFPGDEM